MFKGHFNEKCDIWSIGCILYALLCGQLPFKSKTDNAKEIAELISVGEINLEGLAWKGVSVDAKDMVRYLLTYDMNDRPSSLEALEHPWLSMHYRHGKLNERELGDALSNIYEFQAGTRLKQGVLAFFTKFLLT